LPLRLLEVTVDEDQIARIPSLLQGLNLVQYWVAEAAGGTGVLHVLSEAEDTEAISDLLVGTFGSQDTFRVILLPVEATLPAVEKPPESDPPMDVRSAEGKRSGPHRVSREELYEDINQASKLTRIYLAMVGVSSVVAAVGLIRGEIAIIIGAMVIAPLLGPNMALALASTLGDTDLAKRAFKALGAGVAVAAAMSFVVGVLFAVDPSAPELAARTRAGLGDIAIALAAGTAGSLAFTSGVPTALVGVMVAVALLPPLVATGLFAGSGHGSAAFGALMLLVINVTCINLAAVATFLVQRVRPRTWWETDRARKATRVAVAAWIGMLAILLGVIWFRHIRGI